jgi:membrane-bound lytic murein transglycosylase B
MGQARRVRARVAAVALACAVALVAPAAARRGVQAEEARPPFDQWLAGLKDEARQRGIRPEILEAALADVSAPLEIITERDRSQAEFVVSFDAYTKRWLNARFVRLGRERARPHRQTLSKVASAYGVPERVLLALWGVESNYGRFAGVRPVIPALATLAYDTRRGDFFRGELLDALQILDRGDIDLPRLKGSWAGAMGQPQFMPSSYLKFAVDFDADGRRDIWGAPADVFASMGNYLREHGWQRGQPWGREVKAPAGDLPVPLRADGCRAVRQMTEPRPMAQWKTLGVTLPGGKALPLAPPEASLVRVGSRAFLVHHNYEALLEYNCAHHYALGVALLSERLR